MTHYFDQEQHSKLHLKKIKIRPFGKEIDLFTGSGVFSKDKLDKGSKLLIEKSTILNGWKVLDLGCGIGVIGISLKLEFPSLDMTFSDINKRALMLTKKNIKLHSLGNCVVTHSDGFENIDEKFDCILLNPPQTAGKDICLRLIKDSKQYLKKHGLLQIVARHKKGGKSLSEYMESIFCNMSMVAKGSGYRIYTSEYNKR